MHALAGVFVAAVVGAIVFGWWYPSPYARIGGGLGLFLLVVGVDAVMGPVLTAIVADPSKSLTILARDLAVIVTLQLGALAYGLHALAVARPVILSFEVDRFQLLGANDIDAAGLAEAAPRFRHLSWHGPELVFSIKPTKPDEVLRSIEMALNGYDISYFPRNWREFSQYAVSAWNAARPLPLLTREYPGEVEGVTDIVARTGYAMGALRFLPLQSRQHSATAIIAPPDARVVAVLPVDAFFATPP